MSADQFHEVASLLTDQVPSDVLREFLDYLDFGEPVVGFEYLCDFLSDEQVRHSPWLSFSRFANWAPA